MIGVLHTLKNKYYISVDKEVMEIWSYKLIKYTEDQEIEEGLFRFLIKLYNSKNQNYSRIWWEDE